ncbi:uncharacterized protein LOC131649507 [Vicia villosa]|uniref:uncharacterized protein LOC131649507 n=1 Tax=Vicia villosa TaxID=3911 RepID=UPI00273C9A92|nr:uncharacterized protein LOC131649507 [Vicia villosa]
MSGFKIGTSPFVYLGVPIFKGKPKAVHLRHIADKIIHLLASWKGALLSFAGHVELVKSVIQAEGGLGIRSIISLNDAYNLKMAWDLHNSVEPWAHFLRQRVFRKQNIIKHHIFSSIWASIKPEMPTMENNTSWLLGCGSKISLWYDAWCGSPLSNDLVDAAGIVDQIVRSIITDGKWDFSKVVSCIPTAIKERISGCHIPFDLRPDSKVWVHSASGEFSSKIAYEFKRPKGFLKEWWQWLWSKSIPPSKSCLVWKLLHNKVPMDEQWRRRNFAFPSRCNLCNEAEETTPHLFFNYKFSSQLWHWLSLKLNFSFPILYSLLE